MSKQPPSRFRLSALLLLPALAAPGQYVGKVGQDAAKKQVLRATAVYEYTGDMTKPNASRLVPVVVWDGERYQPGGLYLAQPEPLAVAAGTQYVLEQSGVPAGLFNLGAAARLNGGWVGLGRFAPSAPPPAPKKLLASKDLPVLTGGSGRARKTSDSSSDDGSGPVLHRKPGSETDATPASDTSAKPGPGTGSAQLDPDRPTLHRRDTDSGSSSGNAGGSSSGSSGNSSAPDPDRPTLHRSGTDTAAAAPDPDRPTLHRHTDGSGGASVAAPDPDRPHLRYGGGDDANGRVLPLERTELKEAPAGGVPIGQVVAISDTATDEPHPFAYAWPSPGAQAQAQAAMHALALHALASAAQASFGPAAKNDAALRKAAAQADAQANTQSGAGSGFGPAARAHRSAHAPAKTQAPGAPDPLADPEFHAFELSYGGGATYVYSAHTAVEGPTRRYVTVIAQPDFQGRPQAVFTQTTRGDTLAETPALRLIDAVDANGDHRAELLFTEQVQPGPSSAGRQFALYSVAGGTATQVYSSSPAAQQ